MGRICKECGETKPYPDNNFFEQGRRVCRKCRAKKKMVTRRDKGIPSKIKHNVPKELKTRSYNLKNHFNMTLDDYDEMYRNQSGCCAICGTHQSELGRTLCVDHNHITGEIRGLLCNDCNTAIGKLKTDEGIELLQKAIKYLGY